MRVENSLIQKIVILIKFVRFIKTYIKMLMIIVVYKYISNHYQLLDFKK